METIPRGRGGGFGFFLGFPNLEVGKWFLLGGGQKEQDNEWFFKVTPLIWAIDDQNNESYRRELDLQKDWDCFPTFTGFEL